ncbi:MAG: hypothetical protein V1853_00890 [bacterium]
MSQSKSDILTLVRTRLGRRFGQIRYLWYYGSKNQKQDIDLIAVCEGDQIDPYYGPDGLIDIAEIGINDFHLFMRMFDPVVTEPILTGDLIWGNADEAEGYKKWLTVNRLSDEAVGFLCRRARISYSCACEYYTYATEVTVQGKFPDPKRNHDYSLAMTLANMSFALSYRLFARYYKKNPVGAITFRKLAQECPDLQLKEVLGFLKRVRRNQQQIVQNDVWLVLEKHRTLFQNQLVLL